MPGFRQLTRLLGLGGNFKKPFGGIVARSRLAYPGGPPVRIAGRAIAAGRLVGPAGGPPDAWRPAGEAPRECPVKLLNVGCGSTHHPAWVNVDFVPAAPGIIACDVTRGLPFAAGEFDACYCSHVLEHLDRSHVAPLLGEIHRVLKPGGIVRMVVPDLERLTREYLAALARALDSDDPVVHDDYDWTVIQLLDQSVRRNHGGEMARYWRDPARRNHDFVVERAGQEARHVIAAAQRGPAPATRPLMQRLRARTPGQLLRMLRLRIASAAVRVLAGPDAAAALLEGVFRNSGEIHHWMYDRHSAGRLLVLAGFAAPRTCDADVSDIPAFGDFGLDVHAGAIRKPDSLFVEATKPAARTDR